jgi:hypothetical protein
MKSFTQHLHEAREWVLWGLPRGKRDRIHERILYTQARSEADVERVKALAAKDGWHSFRVQVLDLSKPFNAGAAFGAAVREGVESGSTPQPQPEYFRKPFNISGKIVQLYPVYGIPVKDKKYYRTVAAILIRTGEAAQKHSPAAQAYEDKMSVWRWRVRVQTDEGWMLMGFIGSTKRKEALPPIRAGDTVELTGLQLSARTGGTRYIGRTFGGRATDEVSETAIDYRSNRYDRQLHGKVKRAKTV